MGKVKSFFRGLSCPKSHNSKGEDITNQHNVTNNPTGVRKNQDDYGSRNIELENQLREVRVENFSFSAPISSREINEERVTSEIEEYENSTDSDTSLYRNQDIALIALCNTLRLKVRHNLLVALLCLQQKSIRLHLLRNFLKKVLFVINRNQDNFAREAVITLRQYRVPLLKENLIQAGVTIVNLVLDKRQRIDLIEVLSILRGEYASCGVNKPGCTNTEGSTDDNKGKVGTESVVLINTCSKIDDSANALTDCGNCLKQTNVIGTQSGCAKQAEVTEPRLKLQGNTHRGYKEGKGFNQRSSSRGVTEIRVDKNTNGDTKTPELKEQARWDIIRDSKERSAIERQKIGENIFRNAIKNIEFNVPAVVEHKPNVVWELEFFTTEPYTGHNMIGVSNMLRSVTFSPKAVERLKVLANQYDKRGLVISVTGGGCSGFQYHFNLVEHTDNLRCIYDRDNCIKVFSDDATMELIASCTIDYEVNLVGSKFVLNNIKNVAKRCSCGNSFDLKN
ncbi:iron-sulfur assembly protein [Babesia ovis]|uniref:Iron-sulfur assembly protein n=1 Tax=Babesia ovis TaxID=5869 RepID=A0A9W5T946_BABOV|nr:iron-sulfur assembly protein [Babesia ovis]